MNEEGITELNNIVPISSISSTISKKEINI